MFHPLVSNLSDIKDIDLENQINQLGRKYSIAARSGNRGLCNQIVIVLEQYKDEQRNRLLDKSKKINLKNENKDLDDLININ